MAIQSQHNFNYKYNQASFAKRMFQNIVRFSVSPCESLINIKFNKNEFLPKTADASTPTKILSYTQGLREGGSGGTSYPGPGQGGLGRVEVVASSFGPNFFSSLHKIGPSLIEDLFFFCSSPNFGQKMGPNLSEDLFFCSSPNFGQKMEPNLSEDPI